MDATPPDPTYPKTETSNRPIPLPLSGVFGSPPCMALQHPLAVPARQVPPAHGAVVGPAQGVGAVGVEGDATYPPCMALQHPLAVPARQVPQAHGAVVGPAQGVGAVGVEGDATNPARVALQHPLAVPARQV